MTIKELREVEVELVRFKDRLIKAINRIKSSF